MGDVFDKKTILHPEMEYHKRGRELRNTGYWSERVVGLEIGE